jgi:hypothetical protein
MSWRRRRKASAILPRKEALYSRMATAVSFDLNGKASPEAARK